MNNSVFCEIILITEVLEINDLFLMKEQAIDSLLQSFMESKYIEKKKKKKLFQSFKFNEWMKLRKEFINICQ